MIHQDENDNLVIEGMMSCIEIRKEMLMMASNMHNDISSTIVNSCRINSMRALLDTFEKYNQLMFKNEYFEEEL